MSEPYNRFTGQSLEHLTALSDGLFAVAMTLLVLDLRCPSPPPERPTSSTGSSPPGWVTSLSGAAGWGDTADDGVGPGLGVRMRARTVRWVVGSGGAAGGAPVSR